MLQPAQPIATRDRHYTGIIMGIPLVPTIVTVDGSRWMMIVGK